jgi:hypothetical protein
MKAETTITLRVQSDSDKKFFENGKKFEIDLGNLLYKALKKFFKTKINVTITELKAVSLVEESK